MNQLRLTCWLAAVLPLVLAAGCATSPSSSRVEPPLVAIRNATGQDLATVTVREAPDDRHQARRLGSISPLLNGAVYSIRRRPNPAPLAPRAEVRWQTRAGASDAVVVWIDDALARATGTPNEALIFHILPGGQVMVSVDPINSEPMGGR